MQFNKSSQVSPSRTDSGLVVDVDAILAALSASATPAGQQEGYTKRELVELAGCSEYAVTKRLRELHRDGTIRTVKKNVQTIGGTNFPVTAYVFTGDQK